MWNQKRELRLVGMWYVLFHLLSYAACFQKIVISRIWRTSQLKKRLFFAGQVILILKCSYLAWCNSVTYCHIAASFVGSNIYIYIYIYIYNQIIYLEYVNNFSWLWTRLIFYALYIKLLHEEKYFLVRKRSFTDI